MARTTGICRHHRKLFRHNRALSIRQLLEIFKQGDSVVVLYNSSFAFSGRPHPRLHGRVGVVLTLFANNVYAVKIAKKTHIIARAHLSKLN